MNRTSTEHVPVLIVGGGPTGLTLSALLSRYGVESLLVERHPSTCDHPQAHVVNTRTMEILRLLGLEAAVREQSLPQRAMSHVRWVTAMAGEEFASLDLSPGPQEIGARLAASPTMPASCAQDRIEPLLAKLAAQGPGRVEFASELVDLVADAEGASATVVSGGERRAVRADWVVACDGAASGTRKACGIPMKGPEALAHVVGIYFHADLAELAAQRPAVLYWTIDSEAPGTLIALDGSQRWVFHAAWDAERTRLEDFSPERCLAILARALGSDVAVDIRSVRPWTMTAQVAERYREGRVLLAGDAAHRFPPTGGFGMNTGIQDSHNLAWKLAAVVAGRAGQSLLDSYQAERLPVGQENCDWSVRNAMGLASVIGPGAAQQGRRLADGEVSFQALAAEIQQIADREVGHFSALGRDLGFLYETGALVADGTQAPASGDPDRDYIPCARPGARAPHLGLLRDGQLVSTLDLFDGGFTLLASGAQAEAWKRVADAQSVPIELVSVGVDALDPSGGFASLYGVDDGAVLVRPDGHVGWRMPQHSEDAEAALRGALAAILCTN